MIEKDMLYLCERFCEGITQDHDAMFTSPDDMIQFCLGFLTSAEKTRFREAAKIIMNLSSEEKLKLWNKSCKDVFLLDEFSAEQFTTMVFSKI